MFRPLLSSALLSCFLAASAQVSAPLPANTPDGCPIKITNINPTGDESFGRGLLSGGNVHDKDGHMFVLKVKNTSGKDIRGMKFQAAYFDATEDTTDIPVSWQWTDPLKADAEKSFRWQNLWRQESKVGWRVRLTKVLYEDGSNWEASKDNTCSEDYWRDKRHKAK